MLRVCRPRAPTSISRLRPIPCFPAVSSAQNDTSPLPDFDAGPPDEDLDSPAASDVSPTRRLSFVQQRESLAGLPGTEQEEDSEEEQETDEEPMEQSKDKSPAADEEEEEEEEQEPEDDDQMDEEEEDDQDAGQDTPSQSMYRDDTDLGRAHPGACARGLPLIFRSPPRPPERDAGWGRAFPCLPRLSRGPHLS